MTWMDKSHSFCIQSLSLSAIIAAKVFALVAADDFFAVAVEGLVLVVELLGVIQAVAVDGLEDVVVAKERTGGALERPALVVLGVFFTAVRILERDDFLLASTRI
jgi:hypothetical protein